MLTNGWGKKSTDDGFVTASSSGRVRTNGCTTGIEYEFCDPGPLDRTPHSEKAPRAAAADIPLKVYERLYTVEKLSDEDREPII